MNVLIEKIILGIISVALVIYSLTEFAPHPDVILFRLSELTVFMIAFLFMAFRWIGDPDKRWSTKKRWSLMSIFCVSSWFLLSLTKIVMDLVPENDPILAEYFFLPFVAGKFLPPLLSGTAIGMVYGFVRSGILTKDAKKIKVLRGVMGAAATMCLIYGGYVLITLSYDGSESIHFLDRDQQLTSLEELLSQPELNNKTVYVDLWFSSCGPCITAFQNMSSGKELLEQEGVVTLYLGREISLPDSKSRWINTIKQYGLEGYHVYMSDDLEEDIYNQLKAQTGQHLAYPHYLLIDKTGAVINWDAPGITDLPALQESLDSVEKLTAATGETL